MTFWLDLLFNVCFSTHKWCHVSKQSESEKPGPGEALYPWLLEVRLDIGHNIHENQNYVINY